ncbi:MAG: MFS transporter [Candidatus Marinimicrobia bacterium]|nr:MFS transporter [Candidatus Neomarinimicrobiota bacterium]
MSTFIKNKQYYKFSAYGFLKNLRFFDAFFILFLIDQGLSYTQIGLLYAIREISINLLEIPSGILADTFGRRRALLVSFTSYIASFVIFYFSHNFIFFLLAFILFGAGDAFRSGTHKGMIMDYLKQQGGSDQKISYYGHTRSWSQRGAALSSLIAGIIIFAGGNYQNIFLFSTLSYVLNMILILSYPKEFDKIKPASETKQQAMRSTFSSFFTVMKNLRVIKLISHSALHSAYLKAIKDYIQPLMIQVAILLPLLQNVERNQQNGLSIGVFYFIIYLITSFASRSASKFEQGNKKNIVTLTLLIGFIAGMLSGLLYQQGLSVFALISFVMIYIIENIRKPILTGYVADQVPVEILSSVLSVQSLIKTIMTAGIALIFGIFADWLGIGWALCIVSTILIGGLLFLGLFLSPKAKTKTSG